MSEQTIDELREIAEALSGALQIAARDGAELRRQVATVGAERTVIANQYAELAELFRGSNGMDHYWAVSNAACMVNDLHEITEERNGMRQERDLLRRQVEAMANDMARTAPPENYPNHYDDWLELLWAERVQWWIKWSLEQAKKGGGA